MQINGACHCGRVSFTAQIDPARVMVCHCTDCQMLSGAPFRAVAVAPYDTLVLHGETKSYVKVAESGNKRAQVFCPHCATPLFATAPENPTSVVIRLGCVAQRAELVPAAQIWQRSALPWLSDLQNVPGSSGPQGPVPGATVPGRCPACQRSGRTAAEARATRPPLCRHRRRQKETGRAAARRVPS